MRALSPSLIERLVPRHVATAESFSDPPEVALFEAERAVIARAIHRRRQEFATVRHCARRTLAILGHGPVPLLPGERRAPIWPAGIVGSMTHCEGYRAAAVARSGEVMTMGVDAEPNAELPDDVIAVIARPEASRHLAAIRAVDQQDVAWDRLLFSCKESVFKAWYPVVRREFGFGEASIHFDVQAGSFTARLLADTEGLPPAFLGPLAGRWIAAQGFLVTAVVVPPPGIPPSDETRPHLASPRRTGTVTAQDAPTPNWPTRP